MKQNIRKQKKLNEAANILIVDDNPKNLQVLGKILKNNQFNIEFAMDGPGALDWITTRKFDLILLDINMPGMDGFEVCRRIRAQSDFDNLPIIFLTAESDRKSILKGFETGGQDYVTKPFDSRELAMRVKTQVSLKKSREKLEGLNRVLEDKVLERTSQLNEAKEKAEASDRLKTAFLNNITHEIRTPLNGLLGFGQLIVNPDLTMEEKEKYLDVLNLSGDRLLETITNYMDMSLLISGNQTVKPAAISPCELITSLYKSFRQQCEAKGLEMTLDKSENDRIQLETDRKLLWKAISHIIQNSIKFTEKGSISIGYNLEEERIIFFVRDSGIGIEKEAEVTIFNIFIQTDDSDSRPYEGSGLGLSIAKGYIDLLGGTISFESEINKGTTFYISLPLYETTGSGSKGILQV